MESLRLTFNISFQSILFSTNIQDQSCCRLKHQCFIENLLTVSLQLVSNSYSYFYCTVYKYIPLLQLQSSGSHLGRKETFTQNPQGILSSYKCSHMWRQYLTYKSHHFIYQTHNFRWSSTSQFDIKQKALKYSCRYNKKY